MPSPARRTALITGSSRGIGRAIALELARRGFDIAINYVSNEAAALEVAAGVESHGGRAVPIRADVGLAPDRERMLAEVRAALGRLDVFVNNAGIAPRERLDILDTTEESWRHVVGTNLEGPFFLTQAVARWLLDERAEFPDRPLHIVNISSLSEYASSTNRADYCIAKAGLGMLTRLFADRLAPHGIPVNAVRPGIIETDMTAAAKEKYEQLLPEGDIVPMARWGRPEEVARAVAALVGGDFDFATGAVVDLDGGFHLKRL